MQGYGIPDPVIFEEQGGIEVSFLKDIYTEKNLRQYGLETRYIKALLFTKENGRISNGEYQKLFNVSKRTVSNDLQLLLYEKLLNKTGATGTGTYYVLQRGHKGANNIFQYFGGFFGSGNSHSVDKSWGESKKEVTRREGEGKKKR